MKKRFEYGIKNTSNATNPYLSYIADGNYSPRSLPLYLREENYEIIRKNADRIIPVHGDLMSVDAEKFDFVNLSDIFEYMSEEDFAKNTDFLLSAVNDGARVAYWNMQNKRYITANGFEYDTEKSQRLFVRNKSWFYRDFRIYRKAETNE